MYLFATLQCEGLVVQSCSIGFALTHGMSYHTSRVVGWDEGSLTDSIIASECVFCACVRVWKLGFVLVQISCTSQTRWLSIDELTSCPALRLGTVRVWDGIRGGVIATHATRSIEIIIVIRGRPGCQLELSVARLGEMGCQL